jgi:hypothetical protein
MAFERWRGVATVLNVFSGDEHRLYPSEFTSGGSITVPAGLENTWRSQGAQNVPSFARALGYYKTLPAILSCVLDILFQVCKNPVHANTSRCSTCGLDIRFLSLFAVRHETSLFQEPAHLAAISASLPSVSSFVNCTLVVNKASAVTSCHGSVKEEKGVLDSLPCMSVDGQKHLHARMWNTSLSSSTPTGIAPRDRGFWKGLSVILFGRRAISLDCVERLTEMAGYVNRLEGRRHDRQYCHGCYCFLLPQ